jgi:hypothetical protein
MLARARKQLTVGNAIALAAVFVAVGGSAIALPGKATVDRNDIAKNAVKSKQVKANSLTGADIDEATLALAATDPPAGAVDVPADSVGAAELSPVTTVSANLEIANNIETFEIASCPAGTQVISGGADRTGGGVAHISESGISENGWFVSIHNESGGPVTYSIEANCLAE